jgi:hypothetical protein
MQRGACLGASFPNGLISFITGWKNFMPFQPSSTLFFRFPFVCFANSLIPERNFSEDM